MAMDFTEALLMALADLPIGPDSAPSNSGLRVWETKPGFHAHICTNAQCGYAWEHEHSNANRVEAHTCPQCHTLLDGLWAKANPQQALRKLAQQG